MTLVGRFLVARKRAMSAMMPSDTRNYALLITAFKHTQKLVQSKKPFLTCSLYICAREGYQNYFSRGSSVCTTDRYI